MLFKVGMIILGLYTIGYNCYIAMSSYELNEDYDIFCAKRNFFAFLPLIMSLLFWFITLLSKIKFDYKVHAFFTTFFSIPMVVVNSIHASHCNREIGEYNNKTDTERYKKEKNNETYGKAAAVGGTIYTVHHTKKKIKELTDVDSWKEFK